MSPADWVPTEDESWRGTVHPDVAEEDEDWTPGEPSEDDLETLAQEMIDLWYELWLREQQTPMYRMWKDRLDREHDEAMHGEDDLTAEGL